MPNYTAGTAYLRISPSMDQFPTKLRSELNKINPVMGVRIKPVWNQASRAELESAVAGAVPRPTLDVRIAPKWTVQSHAELAAVVGAVTPKPKLDITISPQWTTASAKDMRDAVKAVVPKPTIDIRIAPKWTAASATELRAGIAAVNPEPTVAVRIKPVWRGTSTAELRAAVNGLAPPPTLELPIDPKWTTWSKARLRAALLGIVPPPSMDVRINPVWNGGTFPPLPDQDVNVRAKVDKKSLSDAINGFATLGRSMAYLTLGGGVAAALPVLGALAGAAVAASGALLLIPAAGIAAGLAIGALKVGMTGFSDVLKETDPAKYAEGLAKLSPAARDAAVAIRGLGPAWDGLKLHVQNALFRDIGMYIRELSGSYLPLLHDGLVGAAEGFSFAAGGAFEFLESQKTIADIGTIFDNSNASIKIMGGSLDAILRIFRDVATVGSTFLPGLASGWATAAQAASEYVARQRETGGLAAAIQGGLDALNNLGQLFGNVGAIIGTVWRAAAESGGSFLDTMIQSTSAARDFLNSANGFGALVTIFETLRGVVSALLPGVLAVFSAVATGIQILGPALPALSGALGSLLAALSPLIVVAAEIARILSVALTGALTAVMPLIETLARVVGDVLLTAWRAIEPLIPILTESLRQMMPPLVEAAEVIGGALVTGLQMLAPVLPPLMQAIGDLGVALAPLVAVVVKLAAEIALALMPILPTLIGIFTRLINDAIIPLLPPLVRIVEALIPGLVATLNVVVPIISWLASVLADVLVWAINTLVVPALDLIAGTLEFLNEAWRVTSEVVSTVWNAIGGWITSTWTGVIKPTFDAIVGFIQGVLQVAFDVLWTIVRIAIGAIAAIIVEAWLTLIKPVWDVLVAFINTVLIPLFNFFWRNVIVPVWAGITAAISTAWNIIRDTVFTPINTFILTVINPAMESANRTASTAWEAIRSAISVAWASIRDAVFTPLVDFVTRTIPDAFNAAVRIIGDVWGQIKKAMRDPVQAVIDVVYNNGIVASWNTIADFIGLKDQKLKTFTLPAYATGGPVMNEQVARLGEKGPEYVLSAPAVRNMGGIGAVDDLHKRAKNDRGVLRRLNSGQIVEGADHEGPGFLTVGFGGVKPWVAKAGHELRKRFGIGTVGGVGQRANASDHPRGLALDFMTSGSNGTQLANHVIANKGHYGATYAIWRQQINNGSGWRGMEDRGSPTANHMDHVHVSFTGAKPGGGGGNVGGFNGDAGAPAFDPLGWLAQYMPDVGSILAGVTGAAGPLLNIVKGFGGKIFTAIRDWALSKVTDWGGGDAITAAVGRPGAGVERWRGTVLQALGVAGQSATLADTTLRRMNQESSGNPMAVNRTDSNWKKGTPSVGLMQVIGPTYRANKHPGYDKPPHTYGVSTDPMSNILASMRYAQAEYGSLSAAYNKRGGYDRGGLARGAGWLSKGPTPERILDGRQTRAFEHLVEMRSGVSFGTRLTVDRGDGISAPGVGGGEGGPLIGTLVVPTPTGAGVQETIDAVMTRARHEKRSGGRYGRRG